MKKECSTCIFWRDKSGVGKLGKGICYNEKVQVQVTMMNVRNFVVGETETEKKFYAELLMDSIRFRSDFVCGNYEPLKITKKKSPRKKQNEFSNWFKSWDEVIKKL